jgi:polyphenol oxidase
MEHLGVGASLHVVTSTRADGDLSISGGDDARDRRTRFFERHSLSEHDVVYMPMGRAGDTVSFVGRIAAGSIVEADALMATDPNLILGLFTADCAPVVFYEPQTQSIALAHCGWRGTHRRLPVAVLENMRERGGDVSAVRVLIGPHIHQQSYRVACEQVSQRSDSRWQTFIREHDGWCHINLAGYICAQLEECGVREEHISISPIDTYVSTRFFSHRRGVENHDPEGRFMTLVYRHVDTRY